MNALEYFNARLEATISPMDYLRLASRVGGTNGC